MNYGPLYAELLMHCTQLKLPRPWHRFAESVPCYGPLRNAASVMPSLEQKYGRRRLLRSGAAVRQRGGSPLPNPLLCNSTVVIHPLGGGLENQPRELIVDGLTLSGRSAPAAVLREPAGIAAVDSLWLTCGSWDWTTLSALGLPAAPVNELADPRPESPADFVKQMTGPDAGQLPKPKRLILVGLQFARLSRDRPPEFDRVLERADVLCGGFGLEPHDVLVWRPSPRDFQTLGRSAHHGRREDVVTALLRSVADSARPLAADRRRPRDLAATTERLRRDLARDVGAARRRRDWNDMQAALDERLVGPLRQAADESTDPARRARLTALAEAVRQLHNRSTVARVRLDRLIALDGIRDDAAALPLDADLLKLFDLVHKFTAGES